MPVIMRTCSGWWWRRGMLLVATGSGIDQEMRWWREVEEEEEEEGGRPERLRATASFIACSVRGVLDHRCSGCQCAKSATSEGCTRGQCVHNMYKGSMRVRGK